MTDPRGLQKAQLAAMAWTRMQDLVLGNDRGPELREALSLGRGSGRVRTLLGLLPGPLSLGEIAEIIRADAPYATLIVNELQARGLVVRAPSQEDRRRKLVALTSAGQEAARTAQAIRERPPAALLDGLDQAELAQLQSLLERLSRQ